MKYLLFILPLLLLFSCEPLEEVEEQSKTHSSSSSSSSSSSKPTWNFESTFKCKIEFENIGENRAYVAYKVSIDANNAYTELADMGLYLPVESKYSRTFSKDLKYEYKSYEEIHPYGTVSFHSGWDDTKVKYKLTMSFGSAETVIESTLVGATNILYFNITHQ